MPNRTKTIRLIAALLLAATLALFLVSCSSSAKDSEAVMNIGGFDVPFELYRYAFLNSKKSIDGGNSDVWQSDNAGELENKVRDDTVAVLKNLYSILSACREYGISAEDQLIKDKVSSKIANDRENYGGDKAFKKALSASHMNESVYGFLNAVQYCQDELYYAMINGGDISTNEADIKALIAGDALVRVKMVLVKFDVDDDGIDDGDHESKRKTAELVRTLAKDGEDFDSLIVKYGNDITMVSNPDGYYMFKGIYYKEFENTAFSLEIGGISDVIETPAGYAVLQRLEKEESYLTANYDKLASDYAASVFSLKIEENLSRLDAVPLDALGKYAFSDIK